MHAASEKTALQTLTTYKHRGWARNVSLQYGLDTESLSYLVLLSQTAWAWQNQSAYKD